MKFAELLDFFQQLKVHEGASSLKEKDLAFWNLIELTSGKVLKLFDRKTNKKLNINEATLAKVLIEPDSSTFQAFTLDDFIETNEELIRIEGKGTFTQKIAILQKLFSKLKVDHRSLVQEFYVHKTFKLKYDELSIKKLFIKKFSHLEAYIKDRCSFSQHYLLYNVYSELIDESKRTSKQLIYKPMLASRTGIESIDAIQNYGIELKYDGIRVLIRKHDKTFTFWSRSGIEFNDHFITVFKPQLVTQFKRLNDFVIDGELWFKDLNSAEGFRKILPLVKSKQVRNVKLGSVNYKIFDILEYNNEDLRSKRYLDRKRLLENLFTKKYLVKKYRTTCVKKVYEKLALLKGTCFEGFMLKDLQSKYECNKRSLSWLKVKKTYDSIDALVTLAFLGTGKNKNVYSAFEVSLLDSTNKLVSIGLVGIGFSEALLKDLSKRYLNKEQIILEVECEGLNDSSKYTSGYAMRFPKFIRIRDDLDKPNHLQDILKNYRV